MKNLLLPLVLLCTHCLKVTAQSNGNLNYGKISYERVLSFDGKPSSTMFTLLFNSEFSVFFETETTSDGGTTVKPASDDESDFSFEMKLSGDKYMVLTDFERDSIQSQTTLLRDGKQKTYIVQEKIGRIKWNIENDFKMITNVKVQKATGEFRGRKYVAWFSSEIPVKYGPWKLNGLPGLILSVADERNEVMFYATSIKVPLGSEVATKSEFQFRRNAERISLAEYLKLQAKQADEIQRLISSKLPRGAKMEMNRGTLNGIELEYEEEVMH